MKVTLVTLAILALEATAGPVHKRSGDIAAILRVSGYQTSGYDVNRAAANDGDEPPVPANSTAPAAPKSKSSKGPKGPKGPKSPKSSDSSPASPPPPGNSPKSGKSPKSSSPDVVTEAAPAAPAAPQAAPAGESPVTEGAAPVTPKGKSSKGTGKFTGGMPGGKSGSRGKSPGSSASGNSEAGPAGKSGGLASLFGGAGGSNPLAGLMGSTTSDIKPGNFQCKKAALIFARGTGEPGNLGFVVGPPLAAALKKAMDGNILIQGADYSTNFSGGGAKEMVSLAKQVTEKCPQIKVILGGYSQGAMQVHQALGQLGAEAKQIAAVVTFGDPYSSMGFGSGGVVGQFMGLGKGGSFDAKNGLIICSNGDMVCGITPSLGGSKSNGGGAGGGEKFAGTGQGGHLSYSNDGSIAKAVQFITARVQ